MIKEETGASQEEAKEVAAEVITETVDEAVETVKEEEVEPRYISSVREIQERVQQLRLEILHLQMQKMRTDTQQMA